MQSREIASSLYREGKLAEAIEAQMEWLRSNPSDIGARLFLFELLAFDGQWDRAQRQALALQTNDAESDAAVGLYQKCLLSEGKRALVYQGLGQPRVLGPLTDSLKIRMEAFHADPEMQARLIRQALELEFNRENLNMVLNGEHIKSLCDGDEVLGPILEVFAQGEYFWIDIQSVQLLETQTPKYPRDLIWLPARLETATESGNVFLPMIYHGSSADEDVSLRLGRSTDWTEIGSLFNRGIGLKEWYVDDVKAIPLIDFRSLELASAPS
jgi:type VI secretion system protein ImpE